MTCHPIEQEIAEFRRLQRDDAGGLDTIAAGRKLFRHLRREFLHRFAAAADWQVEVLRSPVHAIWVNSPDVIGNVTVVAYLSPNRMDPRRPLTTRIACNYYYVRVSKACRKRLGCHHHGEPALATDNPRLELSTRPEELLDFSPWLASLVRHHMRGTPVPEPAHPTDFTGSRMLRSNYAWTQAAGEEAWAYQKQQEEIRQRALRRLRDGAA